MTDVCTDTCTCRHCGTEYSPGLDDYLAELRDEIERLRDRTRWIPIGERLPEDGQTCAIRWTAPGYNFVREPGERTYAARFQVADEWHDYPIWAGDGATYSHRYVTHWMLLPEMEDER